MEKNYRIKYLRRGEWTYAVDKKGEVMKFDYVNDIRRYMNKARDNDQNNPVTFMNKVTICLFNGDKFVEEVEQY